MLIGTINNVQYLNGSIQGIQGATGNGIASIVLNNDYTLTVNYTDGTSYTSGSIRGATGATGATPSLSIGNVITGAAGSDAQATITGTDTNPVLNLTLPRGETGNVSLEQLYALAIKQSISGEMASFSDGGDNLPMPKCEVNLDPIQDLHGYDAPWVGGAGKNKLPVSCESTTKSGVTYTVYKNNSGAVTRIHAEGTSTSAHSFTVIEGHSASNPFRIKAGSYWFKGISNGVIASFDMNLRKVGEISDIVQTTSKVPLVLAEDTDFQSCYLYIYNGKTINTDIYPMIWLQSESSDDFKPYSNICPISGRTEVDVVVSPTTDAEDGTTYTTALGRTVYGGTLDLVSGVLTVTHGNIASYNGETLPSIWISDRDVYASGTTPTTGAQVVYELATPQTYQLTPQQIQTLLGQNNVWSDAGEVALVYLADTKLYINNIIS